MVGAVSHNPTVNLANILRAQYSAGKVALPVDGALYARFRHIQGVPSSGAGNGYSISKLQVIDLLVDRLVQLRGRDVETPRPENDADAIDVITKLAGQIHSEFTSANSVTRFFAAGVAESGLVFDLVA